MTTSSVQKQQKVFHGIVVSDKMDKTIVVKVIRRVWHPKYHRQYGVSRTYTVHDEQNTFHMGDAVDFIHSRPRSKTKRWEVVNNAKLQNQNSK